MSFLYKILLFVLMLSLLGILGFVEFVMDREKFRYVDREKFRYVDKSFMISGVCVFWVGI